MVIACRKRVACTCEMNSNGHVPASKVQSMDPLLHDSCGSCSGERNISLVPTYSVLLPSDPGSNPTLLTSEIPPMKRTKIHANWFYYLTA